MGRVKYYASPAARQAAYRERLHAEMVPVNRQSLARWEERITSLLDAIAEAAHAGDPLARRVARSHRDATLDALIAWFTQRAQAASRPWPMTTLPRAPRLGSGHRPTHPSAHDAPSRARPHRAARLGRKD